MPGENVGKRDHVIVHLELESKDIDRKKLREEYKQRQSETRTYFHAEEGSEAIVELSDERRHLLGQIVDREVAMDRARSRTSSAGETESKEEKCTSKRCLDHRAARRPS